MIHDAKHWDEIHKKIHKEGRSHSAYAEEKEKLFKRTSIVVDLGGGTGEDALFFLQQGHKVVLVDISEFALNVAAQKAKNAGYAEKLITKQIDLGLHDLPLKDNSIDIVFSRISLNYFPKDQTTKIFRDIYRILKNGGKAFLTFKSPDDEDEMEFLRSTCAVYEPGVFIQNGQLKSRFSIDDLRKILVEAGIVNTEVKAFKELLEVDDKGKEHYLLTNEVIINKNE